MGVELDGEEVVVGVELVVLVLAVDVGQVGADEGHARRLAALQLVHVALVVVVEQVAELLVDGVVLEARFLARHPQASHRGRLQCRVDLPHAAEVVQLVKMRAIIQI